MKTFELHTMESAPEETKPLFENSLKNFGMIPNLHAVLGEDPAVLEAYQLLHKLFQETDFNAAELTVVWQTINVEHECGYCVPAHSLIANMMQVDPAVDTALRNKTALPTEKLQVLHETTLSIVQNRGHLTEQELERFYAAGYEPKHILGILLGLSQKVMSNYTNHIAKTPLDESFQKFA
ncbi:carboxymuconolactone decarboxylase family protein [Neptuniibacter sp.]|uniref:carboxymuconolactone decarboxylase family protein n=1 Tax=Neptuniibacter sp. TaxID=1962643 RepID=UPI00262F2B83|nr:carboxymuconolactone decarboxylase family protein [Neptuniibacter sp.]MCP4595580.1 carboxymuconolactone decarboxylase family protein [Neptuniibacter sp.]